MGDLKIPYRGRKVVKDYPPAALILGVALSAPEFGPVKLYVRRRRAFFSEAIEKRKAAGAGGGGGIYFCRSCQRFEGPTLAFAAALLEGAKAIDVTTGEKCWTRPSKKKTALAIEAKKAARRAAKRAAALRLKIQGK